MSSIFKNVVNIFLDSYYGTQTKRERDKNMLFYKSEFSKAFLELIRVNNISGFNISLFCKSIPKYFKKKKCLLKLKTFKFKKALKLHYECSYFI